jgi:hypothetical protein
MRWKRKRPVEREDVDAVLAVLFDIRNELARIRIILEDDDGEERENS